MRREFFDAVSKPNRRVSFEVALFLSREATAAHSRERQLMETGIAWVLSREAATAICTSTTCLLPPLHGSSRKSNIDLRADARS